MKTARLSQRVEQSVIDALRELSADTHINQSSIVSACVKALKEAWNREQSISIPFRIISEAEYEELTRNQKG